jgi:hypothetical protein
MLRDKNVFGVSLAGGLRISPRHLPRSVESLAEHLALRRSTTFGGAGDRES